jgi:hypothetical protein
MGAADLDPQTAFAPRIIELEADPGLNALQVAVGGLIQIVPDFLEYRGRPCEVVCDEEGLLVGKEVNVPATNAWRDYLTRTAGPDAFDPNMAVLVGDVVIIYGGLN